MQTQNRVGQQFGNYELTKLIDRGGYAEVYLAKHLYISNRNYAIKILTGTNLQDEHRNDFMKEAQTLSDLRRLSSHIVEIEDFGIQTSGNAAQDGVPYLIMEYAAAGTMRTLYSNGQRVPLDKIVFYMNQVAEALQCAHDQKPPIIHRDIKPENMLLRTRDHLLLSDFGIATTGQATSGIITVKEKDIVGTVTYMAPERLSKHTRRASDQYSLAIVAYEWLSGAPPFDGTDKEIISKQLMVQPESLSAKYPHITKEIKSVIFRALEKDPDDRYPTVRQFAQALEQAVLNARNKKPVQQSVVTIQSNPSVQQPVVNIQPNSGVQQWSLTPQRGQTPLNTLQPQATASIPTIQPHQGRTPTGDLPTLPSQGLRAPQLPLQQPIQPSLTPAPSQQQPQWAQQVVVPPPWSPQPMMSDTIPDPQLSTPPVAPQPQGQITLPQAQISLPSVPVMPQPQNQISLPSVPVMPRPQPVQPPSWPNVQRQGPPSTQPSPSGYSGSYGPRRRKQNFFEFSSRFLWDSQHSFFIFGGIILNALTAIFMGFLLHSPFILIGGLLFSVLLFTLSICAVETLAAGFFGALVALYWMYVGWILGGYLASWLHLNRSLPPIFLALVFFVVSLLLHVRYVARKNI